MFTSERIVVKRSSPERKQKTEYAANVSFRDLGNSYGIKTMIIFTFHE